MRAAHPSPTIVAAAGAALLMLLAFPVAAAELPVIGGQRAVASINGDPISLTELEREIAMLHTAHSEGEQPQHRQDPTVLLDRLITAHLFAQEAKRMGLEELPEVKGAYQGLHSELVRDVLTARVMRDIKTPDPAIVDRMYKDAIREYRVRSILIPHQPDVKELADKLKAGGDFDTLVAAMVSAKKAQEGDSRQFIKGSEMRPDIVAQLAKLKPGGVSPIVPAGNGWTVFKLIEVRTVENPKAREAVLENALEETRTEGLKKYMEQLRTKLATIDQKLVKSLNFEAPGAIEKFSKDKRVVAQVKGGTPVTVADIVYGIDQRFYHGVEKAVAKKQVNKAVNSVLENILNKRVVEAEALRQKLDQNPDFKAAYDRKQQGFLFAAFVQRAIAPEVQVEDADVKAYVAAHQSEFMTPEMVLLEGLAFTKKSDADDALGKLKRGSEFNWVKTNATGQADPAKFPDLLVFQGTWVVTESLPDDLQAILKLAKDGDYKTYAQPGGPNYVIHVKGKRPAQAQPLETLREQVDKPVRAEKVSKAIEEWSAKLRKASDVKVYAKGDELSKLVMKDLVSPK